MPATCSPRTANPWLVIDPKPDLGDPTYDPLQHLLNCDDRLRADPDGLVSRMADLVDVDRQRILLWLFARYIQESLDVHNSPRSPSGSPRVDPEHVPRPGRHRPGA